MATSDSRPLPQRSKNGKKNKVYETKCHNELKDLFGSTFDDDIILSVAQSCHYDVDASVSALLKMTETGLESEEAESNYDPWRDETLPWEQKDETNLDHDTDIHHDPSLYFLSSDDKDELHRQRDKFAEFEQVRVAAEKLEVSEGAQKTGTTSLCGLKVQYRPKGKVHQSDDDDADVVVEGESESSDEIDVRPEHAQNCYSVSSPFSPTQPTQDFSRMMINPNSISSLPCSPQRQSDKPSTLSRVRKEIDNGYKVLILLRGVPGSGKSFLARSLIKQTPGTTYNSHVFSADDYFLRSGVYKYEPHFLNEAHQYCQRNAFQAMKEGRSPIIIDNTNTEVWEMQPYATVGVEYGYIVETLEPQTPWAKRAHELEKKNTHNVPRAKIQVMLDRYELNISGERLLKIINLEYKPHNQPPQMRRWPRLPDSQQQPQSFITTPAIQRRTQQIPKSVSAQSKTDEDDQPQPTAGAIKARRSENPYVGDALETIAREYSEMQIKSAGNRSFTGGCSFRENNSTNAEKLGPIGCERIHPLALPVAEEIKDEPLDVMSDSDNETNVSADNQTEIVSTEESAVDKRAESLQEKERDNDKDDDASRVVTLSECKDYTVVINGITFHSRYSCNIKRENIGPTIFVNDGVSSYSVRSTAKDKPQTTSEIVPQTPPLQTTKEFAGTNEPEVSPTQSDIGSNNSKGSSFERISDVDVVSLDSGDIELIPDLECKKIVETVEIETVDNFLDIIKNDLSDLENSSCETADSIIVLDQQPDNSLSTSTDKDNNMAYEQSSPELIREIAIKRESDVQQKESLEITSDFESNIVCNIETQLLDATSNFQLVEQLDSVEERRTLVVEEDEEKQDSDANSQEKSTTEQMKNLQSWDICEKNVSKEPIDKVLGGKISSHFSSQNAYLNNAEENAYPINWGESPFPVDSVSLDASSLTNTIEATPETMDCSTNTDPYDFNVAYFGGIDGYKVIKAVSRSINDLAVQPTNNQAQHVPLKFTLEKGSMTNSTSVIGTDITFDLEDDTESEDRSVEFLERFRHLPQDLLLEVYYKLCQRDFNWAVDYISHLCSGDISNYKHVEPTLDQQTQALKRSNSSESSSYDNTESPKRTPNKKKKKNKKTKGMVSGDKLLLQQELEMKFQISEESYPSHCLRVKRWKNREFDEPTSSNVKDFLTFNEENATGVDVIPVVAEEETKSAVETEKQTKQSANSNDSFVDNDEVVVELNVGFNCIKQLEEMFGGGDFDNDGTFPVIQLPKSMAQQLHGFWIQTMNQQFWRMQEQLDLMIAKDAEYARSLLDKPESMWQRPEVPNLREIMEMEMALATYKNDNRKHKKELPTDIKQKVTQDTLYQMYPDFDRKMVLDIYEAHERDFEETIKILEENSPSKSCITMADVLKKRKNLIDELHKESSTPSQNLLSTPEDGYNYENDNDDDEEYIMSYERAMQIAHLSRLEARRQLDRRNENYHKAQEAYRKKSPDVAAYYSDVAKLYMKNVERANETAASAYLVAQLYLDDPDKLDLHYLHVSEAIEALHIHLDAILEKMARGTRKRILIVTGRGARSTSGKSKIKPAVAKELEKRKINFAEVNPGLLRVTLRKK